MGRTPDHWKTSSPRPNGLMARPGTESSNPSPSSGESVSLPELLSRVENPGFPRGCARWLGDRVGRDAQGVIRSRQPAALSLSSLKEQSEPQRPVGKADLKRSS